MWLPTDHALHEDPSFLVYFERYASSQVLLATSTDDALRESRPAHAATPPPPPPPSRIAPAASRVDGSREPLALDAAPPPVFPAAVQDAFFNDFCHSFARLSELGSKWAVYPLIEL